MEFADGESLETDLILFSAGIRPRDQLARDCGLAVGPRGGIVIDNQCRTQDPAIFAIGECALWNGQIFGLVAPGYQMARVVAETLAGREAAFTGADMSTKLKLLGVDVASIGDAHGATPGSLAYTYVDGPNAVYKKIVVCGEAKRLLGAGIVGPNAGELIGEAVLALEMGADMEDLGLMIHPHPTLCETIGLAAEMAHGSITDLLPPKKR